jgi:hypothetical protein
MTPRRGIRVPGPVACAARWPKQERQGPTTDVTSRCASSTMTSNGTAGSRAAAWAASSLRVARMAWT